MIKHIDRALGDANAMRKGADLDRTRLKIAPAAAAAIGICNHDCDFVAMSDQRLKRCNRDLGGAKKGET
jgi:hypothetical protein